MVDKIENLEDDTSLDTAYLSIGKRIIRIVILIVIGTILIVVGSYYRLDKRIIGGVLFLFGFVTQAWGSLVSLIGAIPGVGHIIVRFLALPLLFIINGVGNMVAFIAMKMGYRKEIMDTKLLAWTFAFGVLLGFIIGELL